LETLVLQQIGAAAHSANHSPLGASYLKRFLGGGGSPHECATYELARSAVVEDAKDRSSVAPGGDSTSLQGGVQGRHGVGCGVIDDCRSVGRPGVELKISAANVGDKR
jgi:hypothetical protein